MNLQKIKSIKDSIKQTGKKILDEYENPFDLLLINLCEILNPIWFSLNMTPNHLTTISLICGCLSFYFLINKKILIGTLLYFISYFFDCADGNYARQYKMESRFGDLYDHFSDGFKYLLLLIYIIGYSPLTNLHKLIFIISQVIFGYLLAIHSGCQQLNIQEKNPETNGFLNYFKKFCNNKESIYWSKYVGFGTFQLTHIITLLFINVLL